MWILTLQIPQSEVILLCQDRLIIPVHINLFRLEHIVVMIALEEHLGVHWLEK